MMEMDRRDAAQFIWSLDEPRDLRIIAHSNDISLHEKQSGIFCRLFNPRMIKDVQFYPPAVKMIFTDGTVTVASAQDGDEYNPEIGMMTCLLKYFFRDSSYNNVFRKWIKNDECRKAEAERKEKEEKELKAIRERQAAKKKARKEKRHQRYVEEQIAIQKEAYLQAMRENTSEEMDSIGLTD